MPSLSPLQLAVSVSHDGVLDVAFKGKSGAEDVPLFMGTIDARLRADPEIRRATFDLSGIDPFANAAGRLLDLACSYAKRLSVDVKIPKDIYGILCGIEPRMPTPGKDQRARWRGVTVCVVKPLDYSGLTPGEDVAEPTGDEEVVEETQVILACEGKVRAVRGSVVSVTLFTDEGEVVGEFDKRQFSKRDIVVGMPFEYQAYVTGSGRTMVTLDPLTEQYPTDEELIDDVKNLAVDFHKI
jgi:hypothetical protein